MVVAEAEEGMYRLMCSHQQNPQSTHSSHSRKAQDMEHKLILQMGMDRMLPRYARHKPFSMKWQNGFNPDIKGNFVWYMSKTNEGSGAGVYGWGLRKGHGFSVGLHTTVFQAEIVPLRHV
jgi:hypothetical protein